MSSFVGLLTQESRLLFSLCLNEGIGDKMVDMPHTIDIILKGLFFLFTLSISILMSVSISIISFCK